MKNKNVVSIACCAAMAAAIIGIIAWSLSQPDTQTPAAVPTGGKSEVIVQEKEIVNFVEVEKVISAEMIQENLQNMGVLITQEYDFTEVMNYKKDEAKFFSLLKGEAVFIYSYDGVITAGIDFESVRVDKDDNAKVVTITIPTSSIQSVSIDPESFVLYTEESKWGTHASIRDFADSLSALEMNAKTKAIDKGLLTKADENAERLIRNFASGLVDTTQYQIVVRIAK